MGKIKRNNHPLGRWGENYVAGYLEQNGYAILARNIRTPFGEIDILAHQNDPEQLVFVEVKTRASTSLGPPEISVDQRKQEHLVASIMSYLQEHPEIDDDWRVDVIAVERLKPGEPATITHFENALQV